jgi:dihydrofolate reductase
MILMGHCWKLRVIKLVLKLNVDHLVWSIQQLTVAPHRNQLTENLSTHKSKHRMRNIVLDLALTLDGFIEGPNGEVDWCIMDDDMDFESFLSGIDTIFYGRVSYETWGNFQPNSNSSAAEKSVWASIHSKKKYVFSRKPKQDVNATFITSDIGNKVAEIQRQDGKDIWLYGGAKLITTFIDLELIDLYRISVHPTVLGSGKPLIENLKKRINLSLIGVNKFKSGVVQLIYQNKTACPDE